jgi:hypothetical protein
MFVQNHATEGGGMMCEGTVSPSLSNVVFVGNSAGWQGGAMSCLDCNVTASFTTLYGNSASRGGAVSCTGSELTITNATFSGNECFSDDGIVSLDGESSASIGNSIIAFTTNGRAVKCVDAGSSADLTCCDLYDNEGGDWVGCIASQYGINGNISEDPLFCDIASDDFTLHLDSPCAPDYNPECGLIGAWGVGCGLSAVEPASWGSIKAMFR